MPIRDFFNSVGDLFEWTFELLPVLGNGANYFFMAVGVVYFGYWMSQMFKHSAAGEK